MKSLISVIARIVIAVAGVGYICYHIDWVDKVEIRPGVSLSAGEAAVKATTLAVVVEGEMSPSGAVSALTVEVAPPPGSMEPPKRAVFTPAQLADTDNFVLRPSFKTTLRHAKIWPLVLGFLMVAVIYPVQTFRWQLLMNARGLETTFQNAFRLSMVGNFFSFCLPGSTGGDVVKAWYAARRPDRRTDSIMTVIFDRVAGLVGLVLLAGMVGLTMLSDPLARRITIWVWAGMAALVLVAAVYFSRRLRAKTGLDWLIGRLPMRVYLEAVDRAAVAYRDHKGAVISAVLISIPVHLMLAMATALAGYAMGMETNFRLLLTVIPVIFLSAAIPITPPQGAGVWEYLGKAMLCNPPLVTMNQIVAMLMMIRLYQLLYSLIGSVYLLRGDIRLHPEQEESSASGDATPNATP